MIQQPVPASCLYGFFRAFNWSSMMNAAITMCYVVCWLGTIVPSLFLVVKLHRLS